MMELRKELFNDKRVIFIGFQNQSLMPIVYRLGNLFILPSISETWGLGINEALACGIPVLASNNCGGACDLINEQNGIIFNPQKDIDKVVKYLKNNISYSNNNISLLKGHNFENIILNVLKEIN